MTSQLRTRFTRLLSAVTGVALAVGFSALAVAAPAQAATQDGVYVGENSHGYDISITVSGGKVTDVVTTATAFCGVNPPLPTPVPFNDIPETAIAPDGTFQAHWTYQIDADYSAEYWLGGTFHADGTVTSSGSNAADMVGVGLLCTGTQFTYEAAVDGTPAPQITVTPNPATLSQMTDPTGPVAFRGTGFAPSSTVALFINGQQAATRVAEADGTVEVRLQWQNATVGTHEARFTSGSRSAQTAFTIIADPVFTPTAAVNPSTVTVSQLAGAGVAVTGAGFPASVPVDISLDGTNVGTVTSTGDGGLTHQLVRAGVAPGAHTVTLTNGQWTASATLTVEADPVVTPTAAVNPSTVTVSQLAGAGVAVTGAGFPASVPVDISLDGTNVGTVTSTGDGALTHQLVRAGVAPGAHTVTLTNGQWTASAPLTVEADPVVFDPEATVSPAKITVSDLAATGVQIAGTGFPPSAPVDIEVYGVTVATVQSTATGDVAYTHKQVDAEISQHAVILTSGQWSASTSFEVTADPVVYDPEVVVSPSSVSQSELASTGVGVKGTGFPENAAVEVLFDGAVVRTVTSSADGAIDTSVTRTGVAAGTSTVELRSGQWTASAPLTVTADPVDPAEVRLSPAEIATGALETDGVDLTAAGLPAGVPVRVLFDGAEVAAFTANAEGEGSASFTVADVAPGAHRVQLVQGPGFAPDRAAKAAGDVLGEATLTVTDDPAPTKPVLSLDVTTITTGAFEKTGVVLTGTGFLPGQSVSVQFDGREAGTVVADANGAISYTLKVPGAAGGEHRIALVQGDLRAETTLTVVALPTTPPTTKPTTKPTTPPANGGDGLAVTGADAGSVLGLAAGALALIAAGGFVAVRRRRA